LEKVKKLEQAEEGIISRLQYEYEKWLVSFPWLVDCY